MLVFPNLNAGDSSKFRIAECPVYCLPLGLIFTMFVVNDAISKSERKIHEEA